MRQVENAPTMSSGKSGLNDEVATYEPTSLSPTTPKSSLNEMSFEEQQAVGDRSANPGSINALVCA